MFNKLIIDYFLDLNKPSKKNKFFRLFSKIYTYPAKIFGIGDESFYIFKKNTIFNHLAGRRAIAMVPRRFDFLCIFFHPP